MNTIEEVPNETSWDQLNGASKSSLSVNSATTNVTSSTSSSSASTSAAGSSNDPQQKNSSSSTSSTSINGSVSNSTTTTDELKIIGHLKSIEQINEKRRIFLTNTISEYSTDGHVATETETETAVATATSNAIHTSVNGKPEQNDVSHTYSEERTHTRGSDTTGDVVDAAPLSARYVVSSTALKSPTTPPPKPPMLSRTRSLGVGDGRSPTVTSPLTVLSAGNETQSFDFRATATTPLITTVETTAATAETAAPPAAATPAIAAPPTAATPATAMPVKVTSPIARPPSTKPLAPTPPPKAATVPTTISNATTSITTVAVTASTVPSPTKVTTVQLKPEAPVLRKPADNSMAALPLQLEGVKQISVNHYERLIEELKCPGCAYPMKAPVLLCKTGHSICEQCTRVLMMCPLCKESFTNIRSLTVEALCSKAHFRCSNASGGCTVRLHLDLLGWHEKQCIYKPMKCFMGRVWGDCQWSGREAYWKEHLEQEHGNKVFTNESIDLIWNMGVKQKPLTGYYVFEVFDEMFNFYEVYDKERVLFTMTCTSTIKEKKHNFAFEVTMIHQDNDALAITQKFPVHSEYDSDILMEGTCVSIPLSDLAKFIDEDRLLHYRVRVLEVNSQRKSKLLRNSCPANGMHPIDFQQTQIEGVNLKNVPSEVIVTRKIEDSPYAETTPTSTSSNANGGGSVGATSSSEDEVEKIRRRYNRKLAAGQSEDHSESDSDPEFEAFIAKKWGTPQLHFNRKYLKTPSDASSNEDALSQNRNGEAFGKLDTKFQLDDRASVTSTSTSYRKKMTNTIRKSFRSLQKPIMEMKPFAKKSPEKKAVVENN